MIINKCLVCGSSNLRADRALSGRLVCNACGTPAGVSRRVKNKKNIDKFDFTKINSAYKFLSNKKIVKCLTMV